jgi:hypothetical protein
MSILERVVELALGEPIESVRQQTIAARRTVREQRAGPISFVSCFPLIGRGNILKDRTVSHQQAEAALRTALRGE